ncbi:MAG: hypothetical protein A3J24_09070 [Deltaproteobacteria bacterium RIFCSPLOWO2_02_FULL_53_8]|nr:MAG: hypothetical protein A3J24_09070 [Deltaproteobacteria bacterium RIFCSPLOWO2_02_FULL_53_8]
MLALSSDYHYLAAAELSLLGLSNQAASELETITRRYSSDLDASLALSQLFYENGDIYNGLRTWRLYLSNTLSSQSYGPHIAYPSQAVALARDYSGTLRSDPYLIASIMREESAFNPAAISHSGAMGLMQLMPATARYIAKKTDAPGFKTEELLTAGVNIRLGSRYLDHLLDTFGHNLVHAIAAYNAGPGSVAAWKQKYSIEPDEFVESIPYPETREYTKRVLETYNQYIRLSNAQQKDAASLISLDDTIKTTGFKLMP